MDIGRVSFHKARASLPEHCFHRVQARDSQGTGQIFTHVSEHTYVNAFQDVSISLHNVISQCSKCVYLFIYVYHASVIIDMYF